MILYIYQLYFLQLSALSECVYANKMSVFRMNISRCFVPICTFVWRPRSSIFVTKRWLITTSLTQNIHFVCDKKYIICAILGGTQASLGGRCDSLGDTHVSMGGTHASLEGTSDSLRGTTSSLVDTRTILGGTCLSWRHIHLSLRHTCFSGRHTCLSGRHKCFSDKT